MGLGAACSLLSVAVVSVHTWQSAVALICIVLAGQSCFSANMYAVVTDVFPSNAAGRVTALTGVANGLSGDAVSAAHGMDGGSLLLRAGIWDCRSDAGGGMVQLVSAVGQDPASGNVNDLTEPRLLRSGARVAWPRGTVPQQCGSCFAASTSMNLGAVLGFSCPLVPLLYSHGSVGLRHGPSRVYRRSEQSEVSIDVRFIRILAVMLAGAGMADGAQVRL